MKITQASIAESVIFFKEGLFDKWKFEEYHNENNPCLFFGVDYQVEKINNHKGLKIVYIISPYDSKFLTKLINSENLYIINSPYLDYKRTYKIKNIEIELKDYSMFQPNKMGDKVYSYIGWEWRKDEFKLDQLKEIQKNINYEIVYGIRPGINHFHNITNHKSEFYDNCFVNLNLSKGTGMTTVRELGLMGRKTIMNTGYNFPSILKYKDTEDIINLINKESVKIGTIQDSINCHNVGEEWLETDFWTNETYYSPEIINMRNSYNIDGLVTLIEDLPNKLVMAEIGVYSGESTKIFMNSGKIQKMFAVDLWEDIYGFYKKINDNHNFNLVEKNFERNLKNYNVTKLKGFYKDIINSLPEMDCIYIDASHEYEDVLQDILLSLTKINKGGFICGHDYNNDTLGVIRAVKEVFGNPDKVYSDTSWMVKIN